MRIVQIGRVVIGLAIVVVLGLAIAGVGQGDPPSTFPSPTGKALAASRAAIADGGPAVRKGAAVFDAQHCGTCHSLAATGANGKLGPRMDAQDDPVRVIATNITQPRADIAKGFEAKLMPTDYAKRMSPNEVKDVAKFIHAVSKGAHPDS